MSNDLISRSAVIKLLNEAQVEYDEYYKGLGRAKTIIDNAPTVDTFTFQDMNKAIEVGRKFGKLEGKTERPQGEWGDVFHHQGYNYHKCSNCCFGIKLDDYDNFCPNCGADMRGAT